MYTTNRYPVSRTWTIIWAGAGLLALALMGSCSKEGFSNKALVFEQPSNFPALRYNLSRNPPTEKGFELGRQLFYDAILSVDGTLSCGSCHQQPVAFAHAAHAVSHGVNDQDGLRNAPAIQNMAFYRHFMWDGGIFDLDLQPLSPIENHIEMGERLDRVLTKLREHPEYPKRFEQAFGSREITSARMLQAFSQFMVMMVSANSKYDKWVRAEQGTSLTAQEQAGFQVFQQKCKSCHATDLFTDQSFRNTGLAPTSVNDLGRYGVTLDPADQYKFRVPSLRNVAMTAPYMHDGRYRNLEAAIDHYRSRVQATANLDPILQQGGNVGIALSDTEVQQLMAFLHTLTDDTFLRDPRFAER